MALFVFSGLFIHAQERSLFFSEYIANSWTNVLEIYNPTSDTIELKHYSIIRNGTFRFDFPGGVLLPYSTWVGCRNEPSNPPDARVLAVADTSWPAANSIWYLSNTALIQLLRDGKVIDAINGDPRNATVAGIPGALEKKTLIRKPDVLVGDTIWDSSRGTNADDSQWIVSEVFYDDLGKHSVSLPSIPWLNVSTGGINILPGTTVIDFGGVKVGETVYRDFLLENTDNENDHLLKIKCPDNWFLLSDTIISITKGGQETFRVSFSPIEPLSRNSTIEITGTGTTDSLFVFGIKASGIKYAPQDTIRFYVSPEGLDSNTGESDDQPLRTIQEAVARIAALKRPSTPQLSPIQAPSANPILSTPEDYRDIILNHNEGLEYRAEVHLLPGWHFLDSRINIDPITGGNIHFIGDWNENAPGLIKEMFESHGEDPKWMTLPVQEMPVVSGGKPITGWRDTTVNGVNAWVTVIPEVASGNWYFKQLFVNGKRAERSRFPKSGTFRLTEVLPTSTGVVTKLTDRVRVRTVDLYNFKNLNDVEMVHLHRWVDERMPVKQLDMQTGTVTLAFTPAYEMEGSHPIHGAGQSAYFWDHVFETMSEPGEWYLDRPTGSLFYIPEAGQQKETTVVIAPKLLSLFSIKGSGPSNNYVWDVSFEKIGFMHTESLITDHIGTGNGNTYGYGAISFEFARVPVVKSCYFAHLGDVAVEFRSGTMGGEISSNIFRDLGSGATGVWQLTTNDHSSRTGYHHIKDNDILGYGWFYFGEVAIRQFNTVHMLIEHNYIRDGFFNAITCTSTKTVYSCFGYRNIIRKNHIHNLGKGELSDMGAIYTSGYMPYSFIENNLVYNIEGRDYNGDVIYLDDNTTHFTIRNNILFNSNEDVFEEKSYYNLIENNIIAFGARSAFYSHESSLEMVPDIMNLGIKPTEFNRNIVLQNGARGMFRGPDTSSDPVMQHKGDFNLYWDYALPNQEMNEGQSFEQWKTASGDDQNSIFADPGFADAINGDFRLKEDSPAYALGFVDIDVSDVGPRKAEWLTNGTVWFEYPAKPVQSGFQPSDLPGLHQWLTAKDLSGTRLARWEDRTPNKFSFYQFDHSFKPEIIPGGLNGRPVVHFDGTSWMSSEHKSLEVSGSFGVFKKKDFTIFMVGRSQGDQDVFLSKAGQSMPGNWSIGELQNRFAWGSGNNAGIEGDDYNIRAFRRLGDSLQCFVNGNLDRSATKYINADFNNNWSQYFLGKLGYSTAYNLQGDIAELLVYRGTLSDEQLDEITEYLRAEWGILPGPDKVEEVVPSGLFLFPNPVKDKLKVKAPGELSELSVFDSKGNLVYRNHADLNEMQEVSFGAFSPGLYFISVVYKNGKSDVGKVIKE